MHCQAMTGYGTPLEVTERETPRPSGTEVLLRVGHCGVCHSDLHLMDGYFDLGEGRKLDIRSGRALPMVLGHEIAGHVEAAGPEAGDLDPSRRYAVYPWIGCGTCPRCLRGDEHLCATSRHLGINVDGGYASHVLVPHPRYLIDVDGIAPEIAGSLMCSGITAYSAIRKALPYLAGGPLMIMGLGGVGMMGLQIARALTASPLVACDIDPRKREAAAAASAETVDPNAEGARKALLKARGPMDAAIDFVGAESTLEFAQGSVGKAGAVVVAGLFGGRFSLPIPMFPLRQLAVLGSFVGSLEEARDLVTLARDGRIAPIPVEMRSLSEANATLDDLRGGRIVGRVTLTP
ncbi:MAG: alcohol dehydrogenase [Parvibaculaceae bacterium]